MLYSKARHECQFDQLKNLTSLVGFFTFMSGFTICPCAESYFSKSNMASPS